MGGEGEEWVWLHDANGVESGGEGRVLGVWVNC